MHTIDAKALFRARAPALPPAAGLALLRTPSRFIFFLGIFLFLDLAATESPSVEDPLSPAGGKEFYVIDTKPPSVSVVDSEALKIVGRIPLDSESGSLVIGPTGRFLYVVQGGEYWSPEPVLSELAVIDLKLRKQVGRVPLGWNALLPVLSDDGRYVVCFSREKTAAEEASHEPGRITVIDTRTNEVAATYSTPGRRPLFLASVLVAPDASRIFVPSWESPIKPSEGASPGASILTVPGASTLTVIDATRQEPRAALRFKDWLGKIALSRDRKWLYAVTIAPGVVTEVFRRAFRRAFAPFGRAKSSHESPEDPRPATLHIVDVESGKLVASHELDGPTVTMPFDPGPDGVIVLSRGLEEEENAKLYEFRGPEMVREIALETNPIFVKRLKSRPGIYVATCDGIRYLPDGSSEFSSHIFFSVPQPTGKPRSRPKRLKACPSAMLELPGQDRAAVVFEKQDGRPVQKLAIVDLNTNTFQFVSTKRRFNTAEKIGIGVSAPFWAPFVVGMWAMGGHLGPARGLSPEDSLAASQDGRFVYVLNDSAFAVIVVRSEDASFVKQVRVGFSRRIALTPDGKLLAVERERGLTLIDTQTNKKQAHHKLGEEVLSVSMDSVNNRILALTEKSLHVFDAGTGERLAEIRGFKKAKSIVLPWDETAPQEKALERLIRTLFRW